MDEKRRRFSPEKKVAILREHLKNKMPISELCEKYGMHPNVFYRWEKELFEGGIGVFSGFFRKRNSKERAVEQRLKTKVQQLQEVISWLTEENIALKKALGRFERYVG
ncbi:transposase [candidate division WOR-3 bacterium]|nr:transposase [candidate division WOR-3 bacterium]